MWQETGVCGIARGAEAEGRGVGVAGLLLERDQSMVRPSRRGGVPVLRRQPRRPRRLRASPSRTRAARRCVRRDIAASPQWMRPLRKVPVVMMVARREDGAAVAQLDAGDAGAAGFRLRLAPRRIGRTVGGLLACCHAASGLKNEVDDFGLLDEEIGLRLQHLAHLDAVLLLVALGAGRPDGGAAGGVEQAELDADGVGDFAHDAAEGVDFADEMALGDAADGGIAGHLRDEVEVEREEGGAQAHARGGDGGFAAGVSGADDERRRTSPKSWIGSKSRMSLRYHALVLARGLGLGAERSCGKRAICSLILGGMGAVFWTFGGDDSATFITQTGRRI